jgi:hypothetical protein
VTPAMPLPRVRFTVRRLMVAVAVAGLAVGGYVLRWRAVEYHRLSTVYAEMEGQEGKRMANWMAARNYRRNRISPLSGAEFHAMRWRSEQDPAFIDQPIEDARAERDCFRHARQICERAARCPLLYYADAPLPQPSPIEAGDRPAPDVSAIST